MAAQYGPAIADDAEWKALSARLDIEEAAVNALADPTLEELNAHEAELAAINAAMQAYAAKLEAGVTGIATMQKAECRMVTTSAVRRLMLTTAASLSRAVRR